MNQSSPVEKLALDVIDTWLSYRIRHTDLPGVQICIRKKGKMIFSKAYGVSNVETERKLKTTDMFHIASHSKMFTSCVLLKLAETGHLSIMDKLVDYVPELKVHADKRMRDITLRDLMTHRAGIFRDGIDCEFWRLQKPFLNRPQILAELLSTKLTYEPNTYTKYSNIGYSLLGMVIEKAMGRTYEEAVTELVLKPLKAKNLLPDYRDDTSHVFAQGHSRRYNGQSREIFKHVAANAMASATGFCGTAQDASLFLYEYLYGTMLLNKANQKDLVNSMWPVQNSKVEFYGYGIATVRDGDDTFIGHGGGYPGFVTQTKTILGSDYIISVFTHVNDSPSADIVKFCMRLFAKLNATFKNAKASALELSPVMMNNWNSQLYILGKDKALRFDLDSWNPLTSVSEFTAKNSDVYLDDKDNGYSYPGEERSIIRDKAKRITHIMIGGQRLSTENEFLKKTLPRMLK